MKANTKSNNESAPIKKISVLKMICYALAFTSAALIGEYVVRIGMTLWNEILRTAESIFQDVVTFTKVGMLWGVSLSVGTIVLAINRLFIRDAEIRREHVGAQADPGRYVKRPAEQEARVKSQRPAGKYAKPRAKQLVQERATTSPREEICVFASDSANKKALKQAM